MMRTPPPPSLSSFRFPPFLHTWPFQWEKFQYRCQDWIAAADPPPGLFRTLDTDVICEGVITAEWMYSSGTGVVLRSLNDFHFDFEGPWPSAVHEHPLLRLRMPDLPLLIYFLFLLVPCFTEVTHAHARHSTVQFHQAVRKVSSRNLRSSVLTSRSAGLSISKVEFN